MDLPRLMGMLRMTTRRLDKLHLPTTPQAPTAMKKGYPSRNERKGSRGFQRREPFKGFIKEYVLDDMLCRIGHKHGSRSYPINTLSSKHCSLIICIAL